jgi:hypothetical protein
MTLRPCRLDRFLRAVAGTTPFLDYCQQRGIAFATSRAARSPAQTARRWAAALSRLPPQDRDRIELELVTVSEMSGEVATAHLVEAADGQDLPPDSVPVGAPVALWFALHHPTLFQEVFLHHEIEEVDCWRTARGIPGILLPDLPASVAALTVTLREFFRTRVGIGRFCAAEGHRAADALYFIVRVADRVEFSEGFTDSGRTTQQRLRPARRFFFVYEPEDGTVFFQFHLRARERTADLLDRFGQAILGAPVVTATDVFDLEVLKHPFHPFPDAPDMAGVRVKALHLRHPAREGRRVVKLETVAGDMDDAIDRLLALHIDKVTLDRLRVGYAELQVWLWIDGRAKAYTVRLWPDRCSLPQTRLGDRFRACLRRWHLTHAR